MSTKTFRCSAEDAHFVSVSSDDEFYIVVEDFWRHNDLKLRIKEAFRVLFKGLGDYSEVILSKRDAQDLGLWLIESANQLK